MKNEQSTAQLSAGQRVLEMIFGGVQSIAMKSMAELGIADHLQDRALGVAELAAMLDCDAAAMTRLCSLLRQLGLLSRDKEGRYQCTETGRLLGSGSPASFSNYAKLTSSELVLSFLQHMTATLKSGEIAASGMHETGFYQALQERPEEAAILNGAMQEISVQDIPEIMAVFDPGPARHVVDVGGGEGYLLAALLGHYPDLVGSLLELPEVAAGAEAVLQSCTSNQRCELHAGNFLEDVPANGDIYILKRVLSHCSDTDALALLRNIRRRIGEKGKLLIIDPETESLYGASYNLLMLVVVGGTGVRDDREMDELLANAGFRQGQKVPLETELCIVEALPV